MLISDKDATVDDQGKVIVAGEMLGGRQDAVCQTEQMDPKSSSVVVHKGPNSQIATQFSAPPSQSDHVGEHSLALNKWTHQYRRYQFPIKTTPQRPPSIAALAVNFALCGSRL